MKRKRPTVADLRTLKGKKQHSMLRLFTVDEAAAAEQAGIDIVSIPPELLFNPQYREVAPTLFTMTGMTHLESGTRDEYLRNAGKMMEADCDAIYCSGSVETVAFLAREFIPVVGHVGLVPSRATWTGGFRAVGKTAKDAIALLNECRNYQDAGAIAVEAEVIPIEVASLISERLDMLIWSMGAGAGCDAQYLFAEDILGENRGHMPRHSKVYRYFAAEFDRLQEERIKAFGEFISDIESGQFPEKKHVVQMEEKELARFLELAGKG